MIAPKGPEPIPSREQSGQGGKAETSGGQGGLLADPHHTRADARMVAMAARRKWPVSRRVRALAVERLASVLEENPEDTVAIAAVKALATLDGINVRREQGPPQTAVNVGVAVELSQSVEAALNEPEYLDWLEARGNPGSVRTDGDSGTIHDTEAHRHN